MRVLKNVVLGAVMVMPTMAFAADLAPRPVEPVAPEPEATFTWTGFYAGANAGWGRASIDSDVAVIPVLVPRPLDVAFGGTLVNGQGRLKDNANGFVIGGQVGYNYQFDPHWVVGAEADLQYAGMHSSMRATGVGGDSVTVKNDLNWFGTARLRGGYALDNVLLYATGGLAYGDVKSRISVPGDAISGSDTRFGWTVGAGVEYALTRNWILRAEYLYVDLGKDTTIDRTDDAFRFTDKPDVSLNVVRAGMNYKF